MVYTNPVHGPKPGVECLLAFALFWYTAKRGPKAWECILFVFLVIGALKDERAAVESLDVH